MTLWGGEVVYANHESKLQTAQTCAESLGYVSGQLYDYGNRLETVGQEFQCIVSGIEYVGCNLGIKHKSKQTMLKVWDVYIFQDGGEIFE